MSNQSVAPIIAINRHRIGSDGLGVRTLIAFYGCPLHCSFCINSECHNVPSNFLTPQEVYNHVSIDDIYFRQSNGGLTFGGGEPLLYPQFIKELCGINQKWNYAIETSLNVPLENLMTIVDEIEMFIIDLKVFDATKYYEYTKKSNQQVFNNLKWLATNVDAERIVIRIPNIPSFTSDADIKAAKEFSKSLGIFRIDNFTYILPTDVDNERHKATSNGKSICKYLKNIRHEVAIQNGLIYNPKECTFEGECRGTCPRCEAELQAITSYVNTLDKFDLNIKL